MGGGGGWNQGAGHVYHLVGDCRLPPPSLDVEAAVIWRLVAQLAAPIATAQRQEKVRLYDEAIDNVKSATARGDMRGMYGVIRGIQQRTMRSMPMLLLEDGVPARSPVEARQRWQRHFQGVFGGDVADDKTAKQICQLEKKARQELRY